MDTTYREFLAGFKTEFRALGAVQLLTAILSISLSAVNLALVYTLFLSFAENVNLLMVASPGLWAGFLFLAAGSLGVSAANTLSHCNFVSSMVLSVLAIFAAASMLGIEITATLYAGWEECFASTSCPGDETAYTTYTFAIHSCLAAVAFIEFIAATMMSGYGCRVSCCPELSPVVHALPMTNAWYSNQHRDTVHQYANNAFSHQPEILTNAKTPNIMPFMATASTNA